MDAQTTPPFRFLPLEDWLTYGLGVVAGAVGLALRFTPWQRAATVSFDLLWLLIFVAPVWVNVGKATPTSAPSRRIRACIAVVVTVFAVILLETNEPLAR